MLRTASAVTYIHSMKRDWASAPTAADRGTDPERGAISIAFHIHKPRIGNGNSCDDLPFIRHEADVFFFTFFDSYLPPITA